MAKKRKNPVSPVQQQSRLDELRRKAQEDYQKAVQKQQQTQSFEQQREAARNAPRSQEPRGTSLTPEPKASFFKGRPAYTELFEQVAPETSESMRRLQSPIERLLMAQLENLERQQQQRSPLERLYESMGINPDIIQGLQADPQSGFGDYIAPLAGAAGQQYLAPFLSKWLQGFGNQPQANQPSSFPSVTKQFGLGAGQGPNPLAQLQQQDLQQPGGYYGSQQSIDMQNIRDNFRN